MDLFNLCLCGAQASYPHAAECPYPLYNCRDDKRADEWFEACRALVARLDGYRLEDRGAA